MCEPAYKNNNHWQTNRIIINESNTKSLRQMSPLPVIVIFVIYIWLIKEFPFVSQEIETNNDIRNRITKKN